MVRFKNRWLLVEFFQPDQHCATTTTIPPASTSNPINSNPNPLSELPILDLLVPSGQALDQVGQFGDEEDDEEEDDDRDDADPWNYPEPPKVPFLAPIQPIFLTTAAQRLATSRSTSHPTSTSTSNPAQIQASASTSSSSSTPGKLIPEKEIYHSLKKTIVGVFGDAGWGKVGNSLSVKYFSQTTSLCIIRVARDHYRTVWGALSFMNRLDVGGGGGGSGAGGVRVIARVVGCSGTLKKLYKIAEGYTTLIIAQYLAHTLSQLLGPSGTILATPTATATPMTREDKVRQGEVEAWRMRRVEVVKALRAVDEG